MLRASKMRSCRAASLVELAAGLVVGLPVLIAIMFTAIECAQYFTIRAKLDTAARSAAKQLAVAYGQDPLALTPRNTSNPIINAIYDANRVTGVVENIAQFEDPVIDVGAVPATVTVIVRYPANKTVAASYGLRPFPDPDPLHLAASLEPIAQATFAIQ